MLWHGDTDQPDDAATTWLTATPPPATVTMADSHEPEDGAGTLGTRSPRAGTDTAAFSTDPPVGLLAHRGGHGTAGRVGQEQEARSPARRGGLARAVPGRRLGVGRADQRGRVPPAG